MQIAAGCRKLNEVARAEEATKSKSIQMTSQTGGRGRGRDCIYLSIYQTDTFTAIVLCRRSVVVALEASRNGNNA